jgi:pimeloyl-ACP methyl ester carboxylesterase
MKICFSQFHLLRGRRTYFRVWGDDTAPLLVMLHGWGDASASFQFVVDALKRNWRVIAPDWRGFGATQWNEGPYWFPNYIADLDALLTFLSPGAAVHMVGHSMGGNVATLYAGIRPERVAGIVNLEGFGLRPSDPAEAADRYVKWMVQLNEGGAFRVYPDRKTFAQRLRHDNPRLSPSRAAFLAEHLTQETEGGVRFAADPCHRWANPILYRIEEAKAIWRKATAPMLWVRGADSKFMREYIPDEDDYRSRLACFADVRDVLLDNCGHNLHHDRPEDVARLIEEFFV